MSYPPTTGTPTRSSPQAIAPRGKKRPTEFKSAPGSEKFVNVHKRVKK